MSGDWLATPSQPLQEYSRAEDDAGASVLFVRESKLLEVCPACLVFSSRMKAARLPAQTAACRMSRVLVSCFLWVLLLLLLLGLALALAFGIDWHENLGKCDKRGRKKTTREGPRLRNPCLASPCTTLHQDAHASTNFSRFSAAV